MFTVLLMAMEEENMVVARLRVRVKGSTSASDEGRLRGRYKRLFFCFVADVLQH